MKTALATRARHSLHRDYTLAMRRYLRKGDESSLELAYELGRRALKEGWGVVEMADLFDRALRRLLQDASTPAECSSIVEKLSHFFIEGLSPFEMTHRGYRDAQAALHRLNETLEGEAKRIAHALHDEAGQLLVAVHIALEQLGRELPSGFEPRIEEVRQRITEVEQQLRRLSHELRPPMLDELGLLPALEFIAQGVSKRSGINIAVEGGLPTRLPAMAEIALYRSVQEALNNVTKHARATHVTISLKQQRQNTMIGTVCSIKDDGIGMEGPLNGRPGQGLGLIGIRERMNALGGSLDIHSAPGRGTELIVSVPGPDISQV